MRDFLLEDMPAVVMRDQGLPDLERLYSTQTQLLQSIYLELLKINPPVLAQTVVSGPNPIADTEVDPRRRVSFQVGGQPVTVYKIMAYMTASINAYLSILPASGSGQGNEDGVTLGSLARDVIYWNFPIKEVFVSLEAPAAQQVGINLSGGIGGALDQGGIFIYGFTIPNAYIDYSKRGIQPAHTIGEP